jgi:glycosyltransferase involved in cell wall biosynthesis
VLRKYIEECAMKITFIVPGTGVSGGIKAVFEFANHLHDRGQDVSVIYSLIPMRPGAKWYDFRSLVGRALGVAANVKQGVYIDWFDLEANLIRVPTPAGRFVPNADIVVATWWETAYYVAGYSRSKGEKFYLVQHYEIWGGPEEKVNNTYKLGLHNIVNSTWLKDILQDKLNAPVEALILHAPDWDQFYPEAVERNNDIVRILIPYRRIEWKGIEDGIKAFEIARGKCPNVRLVMFGDAPGEDVPNYVEFHEGPSNDKLRKIYNSCHILLFPSHCEGFGMPPMEAMACKCAVVSTSVGAIADYTIPGETALVSPPHHPELLAENIIRLVKDEKLRRRISEAGYNYIRKFTWDEATDQLEQLFKKAIGEKI